MHPGMLYWWQRRRAACGEGSGCEASAGHRCGPFGRHQGHHHGPPGHQHGDGEGATASHEHDIEGGGGPFGVRRPLRFLAHKLDLTEPQVAELARILDDLKTERAQAALDHRRSTSQFADALSGEAFDEARVRAAADLRVKSAERLRDALVSALGKLHALLAKGQREKLAYLLRTGVLGM